MNLYTYIEENCYTVVHFTVSVWSQCNNLPQCSCVATFAHLNGQLYLWETKGIGPCTFSKIAVT